MAKIIITIDGDNVTINQSTSPTKVENTTKRYFIIIGCDDENSWIELVTEDYIKAANKILDLKYYQEPKGINFKLLMQENDTIIPCNGTDWDIDRQMMKSNIKLIFKEENTLNKFSVLFFNYLSQHKCWLKNCNYHSIKNNLYVYTHNYSCIDNYINNNSIKYNYAIIRL